MKKTLRNKGHHSVLRAFVVSLMLMLVLCAGGASSEALAPTKLKVGATPVPHSEILEVVKPILKDKGILLEVIDK
jgi:D-methionine transport system substrate-binding protein